MGRKCWDSIPDKYRPLRNRLNVVISRTMPKSRDENVIVTDNFDEIVEELLHGPLSEKVEKVWNIGGADIYRLGLEKGYVGEMLITKIRKDYDADVFFGGVDWEHFQEDKSLCSDVQTENGVEYSFHRYYYVE